MSQTLASRSRSEESEEMHSRSGFACSIRRESGSKRRKVREWARDGPRRIGAKQRDCDGKQQPQWTSRAHGANELNKEREDLGECQ